MDQSFPKLRFSFQDIVEEHCFRPFTVFEVLSSVGNFGRLSTRTIFQISTTKKGYLEAQSHIQTMKISN